MRGRAAVLLASALTACSVTVGGDKQLNTDKGEQLIKEQLAARSGVPIEAVECPERTIKQGDVFECTASYEGQVLRITVTQTDDEGTIVGEPLQAILDMTKATAGVASSIRDQTGVAVRVNCGDRRYLIAHVGSTFACQMTNPDGTTRRVVVTVKTLNGNVDFRVE